ncbi:uncharacterized protein LOC119445762 [Dermacentor silvarum]|uniref:uncharacterized protein LOC119445762 n=1 Tax=Dermacentor silvarum TaxID=543639 RepID=UPI0021007DF7|nr:uncharacterized protein LOC119445762 [Dermacentor silvarum]
MQRSEQGPPLLTESSRTRLTLTSSGATVLGSIGTKGMVAAVFALAALVALAYLVLGQHGSRGDGHLRSGKAAASLQATDVANNTEDVVTDEEELRQGTETDTPDSDWIPAEEEARKLVAGPAQAPASRKGRRAASHHSVGAGRNHRFVAAKSARHAAPSSGLPAWPRSATRRPTLSTPM